MSSGTRRWAECVQLMGEIQLEVLKSLLAERYGLDVEFDSGGILYKTITEAIEGVGRYEPLRHYAEVHLKLEPLPRGSGMQLPPTAGRKSWTKTGSASC